MKIAVVSKATAKGGGASKVAQQLTELLNNSGHIVHHYRRDLEAGYSQQSTSVYGKYEKLAKKSFYKLKKLGLQEIIPWEYWHLREEIKRHQFDLIHFHDITTAVSPVTLGLLTTHAPVVWTMHDCSSFTGGCIQPKGCDHYHSGCHHCPQHGLWPLKGRFDLASYYLKVKKWLHKKPINLVSPSKWLAAKALASGVVINPIHVINNSVDTTQFYPLEKAESKRQLGLGEHDFTILFVAKSLYDQFKGLEYAKKVINGVRHLNPTILVIGRIHKHQTNPFAEFKHVYAGHLDSNADLNRYYNAADIFLNCSLADNFPLVVLESLAAGVPVIGFNTGGIPEMIQQNYNGYLVEKYDTDALILKIKQLTKNEEYKNWSKNARQSALTYFNQEQMLKRYTDYYQQIIQSQGRDK
ncbi:glycosyltransferase [Neptunicella sp.]|uniref:glycosyltransferase n=1 Tax=Neptunicella sp. TaxID=2125986 RepID=UPI003F68F84C